MALPSMPSVIFPAASSTQAISPYKPPPTPAEVATTTAVTKATSTGGTVPDSVTKDMIALSQRAEYMLGVYGSDSRLNYVTRDLTNNTNQAALAAIGKSRDTTLAAPTSSTTQQVLANGSVRDVETVINRRDVTNTKPTEDNGNVGAVRSFTERVVTYTGGNANSGEALASVRRADAVEQVTEADAASRTRTVTTLQASVITTSDANTIYAEQMERVVRYRMMDNGSIEQTVRERFFSVTTDASGENVLAAAEREYRMTTVLNSDGSTSTDATALSGSVSVNQRGDITVQTTRNVLSTDLTANIDDAGKRTVDTAKVNETVTVTNARLLANGTVTAAVAERADRFTGDGENVTGVNRNIRQESGGLTVDGSMFAVARERAMAIRFATDGVDGNGKDDLTVTKLSERDRAVSVVLRPDDTVTAAATDTTVKVTTKKDVQQAPVVTTAPKAQATIKADGSVSANATGVVDANGNKKVAGPAIIIPSAGRNADELTVSATDKNGKGPKVTIDRDDNQLVATTRANAAAVTVNTDGLVAQLRKSLKSPYSTASAQGELSAFARDPAKKTAQPMIVGYNKDDGFTREVTEGRKRVTKQIVSLTA